MKKNLKALLASIKDYEIKGPEGKNITGLTDDSRKVKKGYLFVAIRGLTKDGHRFIKEAYKSGANVVVGEKIFNDIPKGKTYIKVKDSRVALGNLASSWFNYPSEKLRVVGVTGTDGKTTTSYFIYSLLKKNKKVGLISTVSAKIGDKEYETGLHVTNPNQIELQKLLAEMVKNDCEVAVVEVTSHGIDQKRIAGIDFDIGVLTNITHEHLDYHKSFKAYKDAKLSFLKKAKTVVLNKDDESFEYLKKELPSSKTISYSRKTKADLFIKSVKKEKEKIKLIINEDNKDINLITSLKGDYNLSNMLAAMAVESRLGIKEDKMREILKNPILPPGRIEKISEGQDFDVYLDFAHTPNALEEVLSYLKNETKGRLIVVVGSAGERDKEKREKMGRIAGRLADYSVFTAEDPRSEDVHQILAKMGKGARKSKAKEDKDYVLIPERGEAIYHAVKMAKKGDVLVVAGKAHEKSMAYGKVEHPWSDREVIIDALNSFSDPTAIILAAVKGTRMKSELPKVLHKVAEKPMISYALRELREIGFANIVMVVGFKKDEVKREVSGAVEFAYQPKSLGTGDAAFKGVEKLPKEIKTVVVLNGDEITFYDPLIILDMVNRLKKEKLAINFLSYERKDPSGFGRILRDKNGKVKGIVEEKDTTSEQKKIKEVNDGLYVFDREWFEKNAPHIKKSSSGEYYIVDLIATALMQGRKVEVYKIKGEKMIMGVNTPEQLRDADEKMRKEIAKKNR